eukprot:TRINITY_DN4338_c0_g1_i1.p1 TRINITY_DN4338_c0_g1~~TRINITY_DN4338_c0_g1_i1.p1  ORF type:complete len:123 (+),score=45.98 TRINITY_DN4338_c0_g1_i1:198-566(+)
MVFRVTYRRRHCYNTTSNKYRLVRTPGNRIEMQYLKKVANGPRCGDCGGEIHGIPHLRPKEYRKLKKSQRTVNRAYGGSRCSTCVRDRIIRAFLVEEQKIVKRVLKAQRINPKRKQVQPKKK